jgi:hypothetical protein
LLAKNTKAERFKLKYHQNAKAVATEVAAVMAVVVATSEIEVVAIEVATEEKVAEMAIAMAIEIATEAAVTNLLDILPKEAKPILIARKKDAIETATNFLNERLI